MLNDKSLRGPTSPASTPAQGSWTQYGLEPPDVPLPPR